MQTFLPDPDFRNSALILDPKRLGNQRLEGAILVEAITSGNGWSNHPAAVMWRNYPDALKRYVNVMILTWCSFGYRNDMDLYRVPRQILLPPWIGNPKFHDSHKSNLLRKDPAYYGRFNWPVSTTVEYMWPPETHPDQFAKTGFLPYSSS